jgi:hypothetical protein
MRIADHLTEQRTLKTSPLSSLAGLDNSSAETMSFGAKVAPNRTQTAPKMKISQTE